MKSQHTPPPVRAARNSLSRARSFLVVYVVGVLVLSAAVRAVRLTGAAKRISAASNPNSEDCTPSQIHISLGPQPSSIYVSWQTPGRSCPSHVWYQRLSRDQAGHPHVNTRTAFRAIGDSSLLTEDDMCSGRAARTPLAVTLHTAELTGLVPGELYQYRVTGGDDSFAFSAAPKPGPDARFRFVAVGDLGVSGYHHAKSPGADATIDALRAEAPRADLVVHVGDIAYADGDPAAWETFMDSIEPVARSVPYMVAVGNHEYDYNSGSDKDPSGGEPYHPGWGNFGGESGGECGVAVARRFAMPRASDDDNPPFWYSFDYGSVHFTVISTEHDLAPGSTQHHWIKRDLRAVDRSVTPWLVLLLHRPMYVVFPHKSNRFVGDHLRESLEHLLHKYEVDAALSGHVHSYYRTCPVYGSRCARLSAVAGAASPPATPWLQHHPVFGTVHFVAGTGGHVLSDVDRGQEDWMLAKVREWGVLRVSVEGSERLAFEFVSSETGDVLDSTEIVRDGSSRRAAAWQAQDGPSVEM